MSIGLSRLGLVHKWIERNGYAATYHSLAECLFAAGALDSVETLCRKFGATSQPVATPDAGY